MGNLYKRQETLERWHTTWVIANILYHSVVWTVWHTSNQVHVYWCQLLLLMQFLFHRVFFISYGVLKMMKKISNVFYFYQKLNKFAFTFLEITWLTWFLISRSLYMKLINFQKKKWIDNGNPLHLPVNKTSRTVKNTVFTDRALNSLWLPPRWRLSCTQPVNWRIIHHFISSGNGHP